MRRGTSDRWDGAACLRRRIASWLDSSEVKASNIISFLCYSGTSADKSILIPPLDRWLLSVGAARYASTCSSLQYPVLCVPRAYWRLNGIPRSL
jgi:hypothetical protein